MHSTSFLNYEWRNMSHVVFTWHRELPGVESKWTVPVDITAAVTDPKQPWWEANFYKTSQSPIFLSLSKELISAFTIQEKAT